MKRCTHRNERVGAWGRGLRTGTPAPGERLCSKVAAVADVLARWTTLSVGGPARVLVEASTDAELVGHVQRADDDGEPVLVLGGGSNVVVADAGFDGTVVHVATRGVVVSPDGARMLVRAQAGEPWDDLVAHCVERGLAGLECLSGIPGLVGAAPIQNIGAYGQEVAETIVAVHAWDRSERRMVDLTTGGCLFGYRTSRFKGNDRFLVLAVTFALEVGEFSGPVRYAELASALGVELGGRALLEQVRSAVRSLRAAKGMLLDAADPDTASAGSFFTNPVLDTDRLPDGAPRWPQTDGRVKTSAAWLIEQAGYGRGYGHGAVGISSKHTLALVNRGGGTAAELLALAREIRDGVEAAFGVRLVPEPVLVGVEL